jgi:hypothetical protein
LRKAFVVTFFLMLALGPVSVAFAADSSASGPTALALAAVVAQHSSVLSAQEKDALARLFNGEVNLGFPANQKISVKADAVVCRMGNVDITDRSCEITFGMQKITLKGREANELNTTASAAGVDSETAAGTVYTSFSHLACTIDPQEIKQKAGGGANCTFETGQ